jgi:hypothetical protein
MSTSGKSQNQKSGWCAFSSATVGNGPVAAWQAMVSFGEKQLKIPVNHPRKAVVHVNGIAVAKQRFASFLNPHIRFLLAVNHEVINFLDRFIEKTGGLENRPVVHVDDQRAVKLVEIEFDEVSFRTSHFQGEFHKSCASFQSFPTQSPCHLREGPHPQTASAIRVDARFITGCHSVKSGM